MIAKRNAEAGCSQKRRRNGEMKPINSEVPQVPRYRGEGENKSADQERASRPIDSVGRDSKNQRRKFLKKRVLLKRPTENNVFLAPGVDRAAVRASELLCFHFGRRPTFLVNCPAGVGQPRGGRTADEQAFDTGADLRLWPWPRWIE
jgi:hypothetical protein